MAKRSGAAGGGGGGGKAKRTASGNRKAPPGARARKKPAPAPAGSAEGPGAASKTAGAKGKAGAGAEKPACQSTPPAMTAAEAAARQAELAEAGAAAIAGAHREIVARAVAAFARPLPSAAAAEGEAGDGIGFRIRRHRRNRDLEDLQREVRKLRETMAAGLPFIPMAGDGPLVLRRGGTGAVGSEADLVSLREFMEQECALPSHWNKRKASNLAASVREAARGKYGTRITLPQAGPWRPGEAKRYPRAELRASWAEYRAALPKLPLLK